MLFKSDKKFSLNTFERKLKKFKREPDQFFKDMVINKKEQVQKTVNKIRPIKNITQNKFTIVSAVYNVGKYLDDYFESIINQSVSFKDSIYIICVDDGSTDNSADIIQKWQKKYPRNIKYIYKENGGQSSARNVGLDYVKTDWVIFTDPDDFLHIDYVKNMDDALKSNSKIKMLVTNIVFYFEEKKIKRDTHSLRYRFHSKCNNYNIKSLENNMNLSVATSLFYMPEIKKHKLKFNPEIKPNFEDGKFIADYMLIVDGHVTFLKDSIYYYRKRSDSSSTLDKAWTKPEKFYNVLKYGHLDMLITYYKKMGVVPLHIQRTALYDMAWYIKYLMNSDSKILFLTEYQKDQFLLLLKEIFSFIEYKTIMDFNLSQIWFMHKVAMLGFLKDMKPSKQIVYIESIDKLKKQILISYYTYYDEVVSYKVNGSDITPCYIKNVKNTFVEKDFVYEKRAWIPFNELNDKLEVYIDNQSAWLSLSGKKHSESLFIHDIECSFSSSLKYDNDGSWIFLDRNTQADDNAEHLYRYILKNRLNDNCYFALTRDSSDWDRLEREGFKLLDYGSDDFESKLKHCSKIISSHLDEYVTNYFGDEYENSKQFVFLQHGITKDNMSSWFNSKKNLHCLITATQNEYDSIANNFNTYKLSEKEVKFTGFPRHDELLKNKDKQKNILIMPTWRSKLAGRTLQNSSIREINSNFMHSDYAVEWKNILHSCTLKALSQNYGYKIIFAPHINVSPYIKDFDIPSYVEIWTKDNYNGSIQDLFISSQILITDYSSVAFEMAYLEKPIIYFQFDKDTIFSGNHTYQKGYFEYERDGFGPVVEQVEQVEQALEQILQNDGQPLSEYLTRMQDTFKFKDGRCCERVYNAILALDNEDNIENLELAHIFLNQAYEFKNYRLVRERAENILLHPELNETDKQVVYEKLAESYVQLKDWDALESLLTEYCNDYYVMKLLAMKSQWEEVLNHIGSDLVADEYFALRMSSLFNLNKLEAKALDYLHSHVSNLSEYEVHLSQCYIDYVNENWESLAINLENIQSIVAQDKVLIEHYVQDDLSLMQLLTYKNLNQLDLEKVKAIQSKKVDFILEKSNALSELNHIDEALEGFELAEQTYGLAYFNVNTLKTYMHCLLIKKNWAKLSEKLTQCINLYPNKVAFKEYFIQLLGEKAQWKELIRFYISCPIDYSQCLRYFIVLAYYRLGEIDEAYELLIKPTPEFNYDYWLLALEIYIQVGDKDKTMYCLKRMYAIFPENIKLTKERFTFLSEVFSLN